MANEQFESIFPNFTEDDGKIIGRQIDPEKIGRHIVDPPEYLRDPAPEPDTNQQQGEQ